MTHPFDTTLTLEGLRDMLPASEVKKARLEEIEFLRSFPVYEKVPAARSKGKQMVSVRIFFSRVMTTPPAPGLELMSKMVMVVLPPPHAGSFQQELVRKRKIRSTSAQESLEVI